MTLSLLMGGNCFKQKYGIEGIRLGVQDFNNLCEKIKNLGLYIPYSGGPFVRERTRLVRAYTQKSSFGDADYLVVDKFVLDYLLNNLSYKYKIINGDVTSILLDNKLDARFENFQVDFIKCKNLKDLESRSFYYNYSCLGNSLGRLLRPLDLYFGHDGLKYIYNGSDNNRFWGEFIIEDCSSAASQRRFLKFLGLEYDESYGVFGDRFKTEEDIFRYITTSKWFRQESFLFENLNHPTRIRNKKRPDYCRLLDYIKNRNPENKWNKEDVSVQFVASQLSNGEELINWLANLKEKEAADKIIKLKFNGEIVSQLTGLQKQDLGNFIQYFKTKTSFWRSFILDASMPDIFKAIKETHINYVYEGLIMLYYK